MQAARKLLDSLMGENRNGTRKESEEVNDVLSLQRAPYRS